MAQQLHRLLRRGEGERARQTVAVRRMLARWANQQLYSAFKQFERAVSDLFLVMLEGRGGQSLVIGGSSLVILEGKADNPL